MRDFQSFLLVVVATALGSCAFYLALFCYAEATGLGRGGPSDLGAAGLGFLLATGSAALGAIVGFFAAVWWSRKHDSGLWPRRIWMGMTLGSPSGSRPVSSGPVWGAAMRSDRSRGGIPS